MSVPNFKQKAAICVSFVSFALSALVLMPAASYGARPVSDYSCSNDNSNNGHYVPADHYWEEEFTAQGTSITGGYLLLGANEDGGNHVARIGIYTGADRSGGLGQVEQQVIGYGGVSFTFPTPITVSPGERLHIAVTGVGDFTAYDERPNNNEEGCFIGRIEGYVSLQGEEETRTEPPPHKEPPLEPGEEVPPVLPPTGGGSLPSPQPSGSHSVKHFSRAGAVRWADDHVRSNPPLLFKQDDCTDFVSKAWLYGGKLPKQFTWWYFYENIRPPFQKLYLAYSPNWGAAENFANAMTQHRWVSRTDISNMGAVIIPGAQPGDVILWHQNNGASTYWSHVALVVGTEHGKTVIDQHSNAKEHTTWDEAWQKANSEEKHILRAQLLHVLT